MLSVCASSYLQALLSMVAINGFNYRACHTPVAKFITHQIYHISDIITAGIDFSVHDILDLVQLEGK